jgi:hypothetical protein
VHHGGSTLGEEAAYLIAVGKQKRDRKGMDFHQPLQGLAPQGPKDLPCLTSSIFHYLTIVPWAGTKPLTHGASEDNCPNHRSEGDKGS